MERFRGLGPGPSDTTGRESWRPRSLGESLFPIGISKKIREHVGVVDILYLFISSLSLSLSLSLSTVLEKAGGSLC